MSNDVTGAPLRRGVPEVPTWVEPPAEFVDRLESTLSSGAAALVEGPAGAGKSTALATWAARHPRRGALWVAPGARLRSWADVLDRLAADIGLEAWNGDTRALAERLRDLGPLVLVVDRADEFAVPLDARQVAVDLDALPSLAVVFASRTPLPGLALLGPSRVQPLPRTLLALTPDSGDRLLRAHGLDVPSAVRAQILAATEGVPVSVLDVATAWAEDRRRLLPAERRSVPRLASLSALRRAEAAAGPVGRRLLLLFASLLEAPRAVVDELLAAVPGADAAIVRRLIDEGHLAERVSVFSGRLVWVVPAAVQAELSRLADEYEPEFVAFVHGVAADSVDSRELEPFHRARGGEPREAAALVLRRWHGAQVPGGAALRAVLRSLPDEVLGGEPVLAALRVALHAFERTITTSTELRPSEDRLLSMDRAELEALDFSDRVLIEAAAAEVLARRGLHTAALQRANPLVEQVGDDVSRLEARGRRAFSYLLVVIAEIHASQLVPFRAMPLALRVLALDSRDRWPITKYRASALAAFGQLFSADRERMRASLVQADLYFALGDFTPGPVQAFQWITEFGDAVRSGDRARIDAVYDAFAAFAHDDPLAHVTTEIIGAVRSMFARDAIEAETTLSRVVAGADFAAYPPAIRGLALMLAANAAVAGRRAGAALDLLAGAVAPPGHAVCFDAVRASAHLALGQPQTALDTTAGCLAMGPRHSVESLASVLIVRSVAHLELRHPESARAELLRGIHLLPSEWHRGALAGLPASTLHGLAELLDDDDPLQSLLLELALHDEGMLSVAPTLSKRELKLLLLLQEGLALTEIAERMFVSINTVKTQCRSLYRKLGVSSRHEAVDLAFVRGSGRR